jgi:hypothetical protein
MFNNQFLLQNFIINYFKTGNYIIDYMLNFSILSFISYICDNFKLLNWDFSLFYPSIYSNIIIESKEITHFEKNSIKISRMNYSKNFKAIIYYIKIIKPKGIHSKREAEKNNENDEMFDLFIPDQKEHFLLENDIYCQIKISKTYVEKNNRKDISKIHTIKLFSYNKNITVSDLEDFIQKCVGLFNEYLSNKLFKNKYYFSYINTEENVPFFNERNFITNRTFDTIFFEEKDKYISSLNFFIENEDWYIKKGIPYHYGILLHGIPGCGKTSIIKATLKYTDRYGISIPLNRVETCGELENIIFNNEINDKFIPNNKRIYIFEDIDCLCDLVKNRENKNLDKSDQNINIDLEILNRLNNLNDKKLIQKQDDKLTLSCLLNIIDGILEVPGRIIILTTNYIEKIDKALLRPGRIDCNINLKLANNKITKELLSFFYGIDNESINLMCDGKIVDYVLSPAEIINICQTNNNSINNAINEISNKHKPNLIKNPKDEILFLNTLPC